MISKIVAFISILEIKERAIIHDNFIEGHDNTKQKYAHKYEVIHNLRYVSLLSHNRVRQAMTVYNMI